MARLADTQRAALNQVKSASDRRAYEKLLYPPQNKGAVPAAVTPPASTAAYTNTTSENQIVYLAGGTVTVIAINGVATGLTSGSFLLNPGDTLTPTYSVAPTTFTVKQC